VENRGGTDAVEVAAMTDVIKLNDYMWSVDSQPHVMPDGTTALLHPIGALWSGYSHDAMLTNGGISWYSWQVVAHSKCARGEWDKVGFWGEELVCVGIKEYSITAISFDNNGPMVYDTPVGRFSA